jgi:phage/plasmid-like protein (TIGR03299 family)
MSHEVETMAWANTVPWHGLGVKVADNLSAQQMLKAARLDWEVNRVPLFTEAKIEVPGFAGLQRSDNHKILDIVGSQYRPVQNKDAFTFFKEFVEEGKAKMETAGSLKEGRMVWGLANLGNEFTLPGKDKVKGYLLVASPHEQGKSLQIKFTAVRVVCNNTLTQALSGAKTSDHFRMNHRILFNEDTMSRAKQILGLANDQFDAFATISTKLAKKKMSKPATEEFFRQVFDGNAPPDQVYKPSKAALLAIEALTNAPGHNLLSSQGTAWGALNAVTYVTDHLLGRTPDARLQKAWFGKTATLKQKALDLATNL